MSSTTTLGWTCYSWKKPPRTSTEPGRSTKPPFNRNPPQNRRGSGEGTCTSGLTMPSSSRRLPKIWPELKPSTNAPSNSSPTRSSLLGSYGFSMPTFASGATTWKKPERFTVGLSVFVPKKRFSRPISKWRSISASWTGSGWYTKSTVKSLPTCQGPGSTTPTSSSSWRRLSVASRSWESPSSYGSRESLTLRSSSLQLLLRKKPNRSRNDADSKSPNWITHLVLLIAVFFNDRCLGKPSFRFNYFLVEAFYSFSPGLDLIFASYCIIAFFLSVRMFCKSCLLRW